MLLYEWTREKHNRSAAKQHIPETCHKTAYTSLVRSLLEYSSTVWDPYVQKEIDKIEGIQRRAARYIKGDYQSRNPGCVTAMLQELDLPSLQERRRQNRLTFLFKIIEGHLPGIKAEKHLAPILNKRLIRPTRSENQKKCTTICKKPSVVLLHPARFNTCLQKQLLLKNDTAVEQPRQQCCLCRNRGGI